MRKRKRTLGAVEDTHKMEAKRDFARATTRAKEAVHEAQRGRCESALNDFAAATEFYGSGQAHVKWARNSPRSTHTAEQIAAQPRLEDAMQEIRDRCLVGGPIGRARRSR